MRPVTILFLTFLFFSAIISAQNTSLKSYPIHSADPRILESVISHVLSEQGKVVYDANTHSMLVIDMPENLRKVTALIKEVDAVLPMVSVEVVVAEASQRFLKEHGLSGGRIVLPQGKFEALLSISERQKDMYIRSKSMITTQSNSPGRIQVTQDAVIAILRYIYFPGGASIDVPVMGSIGDSLEVLPRVNHDNTISLVINPSMSTLTRSGLPRERSLSTEVILQDGETLASGGVEREETSQENRATFLGLPLSRSAREKSKNLVIFVTAEVLK